MTYRSILLAAALVLAGTAAAMAQEAVPKGDATAGSHIYHTVGCWECHGGVGQGGVESGPRLADTQLPYAAFLSQLRVPQNEMPPYEPTDVSAQQAADIFAYLESLPTPQPVKDIPLLNDLN